jgi:DNA-binding beta-propeller fold protein YncE
VRIRFLAALVVALALLPAGTAAGAPEVRDVLVVGNNWEGTADVVDPYTFERLTRLNIIPDEQERLAEIMTDPAALGYFQGINLLIGEGNNQYVDDAFTSPDGRFLYVGRPSFKDVVAFDLGTKQIVWRFQVDGYRSDHMAVSPDGRLVLVSASTGDVVHAIDTATGKEAWRFESGDSPHENNYSADGNLIFHASIGEVYTPTDDPALDASKGRRYFQVVDANTHQILQRIDMGQKLDEAGYPDMSSAVRPMAIAPDEKRIYLQVSFFHGFVEYDVEQQKVLRVVDLPISEEAKKLRREDYLLDSAHHGIAINPEGTKLCVAGTMSDYAAVVSRATFAPKIAEHGKKPYWVTNSGDGRYCFISFSGDDRVSVVSYADEREVGSVPVGDHPQRMRMGVMRSEYLPSDTVPPRILRARVVRRKRGRGRVLRVRLSENAVLRIAVERLRRVRRARKSCLPPARKASAPRVCSPWTRVRVLRPVARHGLNRFRLGKLRARRRYRLLLTATDDAGNTSPRKVVRFRVKRRRAS